MATTVRISIDADHLEATPDNPVSLQVRIYNAARIVDEFVVSVVGLDASWVATDPPSLSLLPDSEGTVRVTMTIPRDAPLPAGERVIGIKVTSIGSSGSSRVEELRLDVAAVSESGLVAEPQLVRGGRSSHFRLEVDNRGNHPLSLELEGQDPESVVRFRFAPPQLEIPPHELGFAQMKASAPRALTGSDVQRALTVHARGGETALSAQVTFAQKPWLSRGLLMALPVLLLLAGLAVGVACGTGNCPGGGAAEPAAAEGAAEEAAAEEAAGEASGAAEASEPGEGGGASETDEPEPPGPEPQFWTHEFELSPGTNSYYLRLGEAGTVEGDADWEPLGRVLVMRIGVPVGPVSSNGAAGSVDHQQDVPGVAELAVVSLVDTAAHIENGPGLEADGGISIGYPSIFGDSQFEHDFELDAGTGSVISVIPLQGPGKITVTATGDEDIILRLYGPAKQNAYAVTVPGVPLQYTVDADEWDEGDIWWVEMISSAPGGTEGSIEVSYP